MMDPITVRQGGFVKLKNQVVRNDGDKTRASLYETSTAQVVVVDWWHPNYGYWSDAGLFARVLHSTGWQGLCTAGWMAPYVEGEDADIGSFVKDHPEFGPLFEIPEPQLGLFRRLMRDAR